MVRVKAIVTLNQSTVTSFISMLEPSDFTLSNWSIADPGEVWCNSNPFQESYDAPTANKYRVSQKNATDLINLSDKEVH